MAAKPRDDEPRNTRQRTGWDQGDQNLTEAEWRGLIAAADKGRLEDVDA